MNNLISKVYSLGHLNLIIIEVVLWIFAIIFYRRDQRTLAMIVLPLVLASTIYDNSILWSGKFIGEGQFLEILSQVRFLLHYLIVPLFIVVAVELAYLSDASWAKRNVRILSWVLSVILAGYDVVKNFIGLKFVPRCLAGNSCEKLAYLVPRYIAQPEILPLTTIIINIFVLLVGIGIWFRLKHSRKEIWPWLFVGALISLVGNAVSFKLGTFPGSASECVLALSLLFTQQKLQGANERSESVSSATSTT